MSADPRDQAEPAAPEVCIEDLDHSKLPDPEPLPPPPGMGPAHAADGTRDTIGNLEGAPSTRTFRDVRRNEGLLSGLQVDSKTVVANRYRIENVIGQGGMAHVYRVQHLQLGKSFALKLLRTAFSGDNEARELFYREAQLASSLVHPNIVSVVDFGEDPKLGAFMVMELLEGEPVSQYLHREGRIGQKPWCDLLVQMAEAVHYIHQKGIVHGDIKPDNILLCKVPTTERRKFVLKLLDFGLARPGSTGTQKTIAGTPEYMAPERIRGEAPRPCMDIYSLGVVAFELFTGTVPFHGTLNSVLHAHLQSPVPPFAQFIHEPFEERIEALVQRALAKDPAERQKDIAAFLYELRTLMSMLGLSKRGRTTQVRSAPSAERRERAAVRCFEMTVPVAGVNVDGTIVVANEAFNRLLSGSAAPGVEGLNLYATKIMSLYPALSADLRRVHIERRGGRAVQRVIDKHGTPVDLQFTLAPGDQDAGDVVVTVHAVRDESDPAR